MKKTIIHPLAIQIILSASLLGQTGTQIETFVPVCEGIEPTLLRYGEITEGARIDTPADADPYRVVAAAGDVIEVWVKGGTNDLDPRIELRDPFGALVPLTVEACSAPWNGTCSFGAALTTPPLAAGIHALRVFDWGADNVGAYELLIERVPPPIAPSYIPYGTSVSDRLDRVVDTDWWRWRGSSGDMVEFFVNGLTNDLDPEVVLYDAAGTALRSNSCSAPWNGTCIVTLAFTVPSSGDYFVRVRDVGTDNAGNYAITLNCIFSSSPSGNCPGYPNLPCTAPPTITSVDPPVLHPAGGHAVTVRGSGFCGTQGLLGIQVGGVPVPSLAVSLISNTAIVFPAPSLPPGVHTLSITTVLPFGGTASWPVEVRDAALVATGPTLDAWNVVTVRSSAPVGSGMFLLVSNGLGPFPLGPYGSSALAWSLPLFPIALSDPAGGFFTPTGIPCSALDARGSWRRSYFVPTAFAGLTLHFEAYVIDPAAPNGLFHQSNLLSLSF